MRKSIKIKLTGYGRETVELVFDTEPTLDAALAEAGWTISASEKLTVSGQEATREDVLENGDVVVVLGKKDGGSSK